MLAATTAPAALQDVPALVVETARPAAAAGLLAGDRLVSYDGAPLRSPAALQAAEEHTFNKAGIAIGVQRGDSTLTLMMPPGPLGLQVRPVLPPAALTPYEEGRAALRAQNTDDAIARWTVAARAAREAGDLAASAWLHGQVGSLHEGRRQWAQAIAAHTAAWELLRDEGDPAAQSRTLAALGRSSQNASDFAAARQWYTRAEEVDSTVGHDTWAASDLNSLGVIARTTGDLAAALDYYGRALRIRERLAPGSSGVATVLNNLGTLAYDRGDLPAAQD
jgi:tetratricopeptide (TPR) repeat protein